MLRLTVLETVKHTTEENAAHERDGRKVSFIAKHVNSKSTFSL